MSKGFDYSKWDNIELSDDEDDVHPNIDRESWFRMKHRSRVDREDKEEADKKRIRDEVAGAELRMKEVQRMLSDMDRKGGGGDDDDDDDDDDDLEDRDGLLAELEELKAANARRQEKLDEYEKNKKWNVDNICHVVEEKTIVTKGAGEERFDEKGYALPPADDGGDADDGDDADVKEKMEGCEISDDSGGSEAAGGSKKKEAPTSGTTDQKAPPVKASPPPSTSAATAPELKATATKKAEAGPKPDYDSTTVSMMSYVDFTEKYSDILEEFMAIKSMDKSKDYLLQHGAVLLQENASSYLLLASLEDEMNGFRDKMRLTARQSQIMTNITELAKTMKRHPGNVIVPFFNRMEEPEHLKSFLEGVEVFIEKVKARAVVKKREMDAEMLKEAALEGGTDLQTMPKEERLGPGGLDPLEVFDTLPVKMQEAFESREVERLKEALLELDPTDAEYHMKRCVDSGLWTE